MSVPPPLGATYRLQLHREFTFDDARELVPYLERLGVTHVYSSPILKARPGSMHGYDVADPTTANPELGGEEARQRWTRAIAAAGLGLLLDIVPNHMGTGSANPLWEDVLTHGAASRYGRWFDIRWTSTAQPLRGHVLLPVLGDKLPKVIERNELTVALDEGGLRLHYFDNDFPLDPATWPAVLERASGAHAGRGERTAPRAGDLARLEEITAALKTLPRRAAAHAGVRADAAAELIAELATLLRRSPPIRRRIESAAESFGRGAKGRERMRALVDGQAYRLAFWRRAARLINYRRFFDINELVALRMEQDEVFAHVHARVLEWIERGEVHGLRVDHIDGLLDPLGYLERLRREVNARAEESPRDGVPILVEKILTPGERLREEWPVQGTTGYEFLNDLEPVFIEPTGVAAITAFYHALRPGTRRDPLEDFEEVAMRGKLRILTGSLAPDVRGLATMLLPIARRDPRVRTSGAARLAKALTEWLACFPVYRTYIDGRTRAPNAADRDVVERVVRRCTERGRIAPHVIAFLRDVMLKPDGEERDAKLRIVAKLQQTSGPATAKGVEDTALYQYVPLVSLNEVGGDPARPLDDAVRRFHEANAERARVWPRNLLCTNTHDTKRSADVRARLDVLTEAPDLWTAAVGRWRTMNAPHRQRVGGRVAPDANSEYLLYQTLVGIWPLEPERRGRMPNGATIARLRERAEEYMLKAVKEAKLHSSWTDPNEEFEEALKSFIAAILPSSGAASSPFLRDLVAVATRVGRSGLWNSLSRIVLHMTSPGVPDLYRGDELWNFTLVDPDNRRRVDFERRSALLAEIAERYDASADSRATLLDEIVANPEDDRTKLLVTWRTLQARRARAELFAAGSYEPLEVQGDRARHIVGFARRLGDRSTITVASRLTYALSGSDRAPIGADVWGHTHVVLPAALGSGWRCAITGQVLQGERRSEGVVLELSAVLNQLPVAVLENSSS